MNMIAASLRSFSNDEGLWQMEAHSKTVRKAGEMAVGTSRISSGFTPGRNSHWVNKVVSWSVPIKTKVIRPTKIGQLPKWRF